MTTRVRAALSAAPPGGEREQSHARCGARDASEARQRTAKQAAPTIGVARSINVSKTLLRATWNRVRASEVVRATGAGPAFAGKAQDRRRRATLAGPEGDQSQACQGRS